MCKVNKVYAHVSGLCRWTTDRTCQWGVEDEHQRARTDGSSESVGSIPSGDEREGNAAHLYENEHGDPKEDAEERTVQGGLLPRVDGSIEGEWENARRCKRPPRRPHAQDALAKWNNIDEPLVLTLYLVTLLHKEDERAITSTPSRRATQRQRMDQVMEEVEIMNETRGTELTGKFPNLPTTRTSIFQSPPV